MKTQLRQPRRDSANALVITMILSATALLTLAGVLGWSSGGARQSNRFDQYTRTASAAEAGSQKAMGQLWSDFQNGGEAVVTLNLNSYRTNVPSVSDSSFWTNWQFSDSQGNVGQTYVQRTQSSNYTAATGTYSGLYGFNSTYDIISDATQTTGLQSVTVGSLQEVQLTRIPIFQWMLYSSDDMEVGCTQPFGVGGYVHANGNLYTEPDYVVVYFWAVTTVSNVVFGRSPQDYNRGTPSGFSAFIGGYTTGSPFLTLPIGTNNTPSAIQQIVQPPPAGEDATSPMGRARYYNQVDLIISVSASSAISAKSGYFNNFSTFIPSNQLAQFVTLTNQFYDGRENKTVRPIDINIGQLVNWSATNNTLYPALGRNLNSLYVLDNRGLGGTNLPAVRLYNGMLLPPLGLTVATALPLYVWGDYNQTNLSYYASATGSLPASLVADAITVLSTNWSDANSTLSLSNRVAASDEILIAGLISGQVYTTNGHYSGGMENFIRLLEDWGNSSMWYDGSLIKMFPSVYATNYWPGPGTVYNYPLNNHYYWNLSYSNATTIPPLTPSFDTITLTKWATLTPNTTNLSTNQF